MPPLGQILTLLNGEMEKIGNLPWSRFLNKWTHRVVKVTLVVVVVLECLNQRPKHSDIKAVCPAALCLLIGGDQRCAAVVDERFQEMRIVVKQVRIRISICIRAAKGNEDRVFRILVQFIERFERLQSILCQDGTKALCSQRRNWPRLRLRLRGDWRRKLGRKRTCKKKKDK